MNQNDEDSADSIASQFDKLMRNASDELGVSEELILGLKSVKSLKRNITGKKNEVPPIVVVAVILLIAFTTPILLHKLLWMQTEVGYQLFDKYFSWYGSSTLEERCIIQAPFEITMAFRGPITCDECANITGVHRVTNLSQDEFLENYAFSMQPVIVSDGQNHWTAKDIFSFDFFRSVYSEGSQALERVTKDCQFFPYNTEFTDFSEMLNMTRDRVEGKGKPWYVGWSNCDGKAANVLRKHYKFPYFLSPELEHSKTDWVFMGLPGHGAFMHIDAVGTLSWQAQIRGTKKWILQSPPECAGICIHQMEIIVEPGDIIVLDTNKWYHSTLILGNETSIVIGSEYY